MMKNLSRTVLIIIAIVIGFSVRLVLHELMSAPPYPDLHKRLNQVWQHSASSGERLQFYWGSSNLALVKQTAVDSPSSQCYYHLSVQRGGITRELPLPQPVASLIKSGNRQSSISPHGDYFVTGNVDRGIRTMAEYDMSGNTLLQKSTRLANNLDTVVFAPAGPLWVEMHHAWAAQSRGTVYVHQPQQPDIAINTTANGYIEGMNTRNELVPFRAINDIQITETTNIIDLQKEPGKFRQKQIANLPSDIDLLEVALSPVTEDILMLASVPPKKVFRLSFLRNLPATARIATPGQILLFRLNQNSPEIVNLGGIAISDKLVQSVVEAQTTISWLPDGRHFSLFYCGKLYTGNAY